MLQTEEMKKVSLIVHKRRLSDIIKQLGERGLIQITKSKTKTLETGRLDRDLIGKIRETQEKVSTLLNQSDEFREETKIKKLNFKGASIEEILDQIITKVEDIYNNWTNLQKKINNLHLKKDEMRNNERLWRELLKFTQIDFKRITHLKNFLIRIGYLNWKNIELFNKALERYPHFYYDKRIDDELVIFMVSSLQKYGNQISQIEEAFHATMIENLEEISLEKYQKIQENIEQVEQDKITTENELKNIFINNFYNLRAYREVLTNLHTIYETEGGLNLSYHFVTIEGWIPVSKLPIFTKFTKRLPADIKVLISEEIDPDDKPPSIVKHNRFTKVFGMLTRLYGLPGHREIDPTVILIITFPILFGLMFGDVGHGIMLLIGGVFFYFFLNWKKKGSSSWRNLSLIIVLCGVSAIICGFLYGAFFGISGLFAPILFNPIENVGDALRFSVIVGAVMLSLGFALEGLNAFIQGKKWDSVLVALPKILFFCGGVYIVIIYGFDIMGYFVLWEFMIFLVVPAIILIVGKTMIHVMSFGRVYPSKKTTELMGSSILDTWEMILNFLSHVPSFARIFALTLIHIGLTSAVIALYSISGPIIGPVILVLGHVFVVLFEFLLVFVHNLRLHFHEFFGKFYHGEGQKFTPFVLSNKFSELNLKTI